MNSSRQRLWDANAAFAAAVEPGARVLDAGAGAAPYRELFAHADYESADFELVDKPYGKSTYVCDLAAIPVDDARFDYVVFNQVMEHLPDPGRVLAELHRVLKPGGRLIYTGPLFYEEHEQPYDFYRYTQFGLQHLFGVAGFAVERLEWLEGYYGTVGYQLGVMARDLPTIPRGMPLAGIFAPVMLLFKLGARLGAEVFHRLELRHKHTDSGFPKNYLAVVRKEA